MIYATGQDFRAAAKKRVLLFGMSGLGKTYLSNMLRGSGQAGAGGWFHYSVDYRIGTRYMNEYIADNSCGIDNYIWIFGIPDFIQRRFYRNSQWVIASVVSTFDFNNAVLASKRTSSTDCIHR